jgi:tripartite-type tricarboxylate transporter receptor subunit TctC
MNVFIRALTVIGLALLAQPALAQANWPEKPVKLVVGFTPGSATDVTGRMFAQRFGEAWGQPVVVENVAGNSGAIGTDKVAKAAPDGYTFMWAGNAAITILPSLQQLPFDPVKDFEHITTTLVMPSIFFVNNDLPVKSLADLIAYARANPGKLNYSSGGQGSAAHIASAYLAYRAGIDAVHVPYRGTAPSVNDLVAGNVQFTLTGGPAVLPLAEGGQLRVLGVASRERVGFAPDLPTLVEGGLPDFEAVQWYGVVAPARTPRPIVERLNHEINALLGQLDFAAALARDGAIARPETPDGFGKLIASELALWRDVITRAGIKAAE